MVHINPYIRFNGNAEEAFTFYKSVFGGAFTAITRYKTLSSPEYPIPEMEENKLMHVALSIGRGAMLMASDTLEMMGRVTESDNRNTIFISAETREEADELFDGLSTGGTIEMPIADGPLGSYFGMLADKFGVQWMVQFNPSKS